MKSLWKGVVAAGAAGLLVSAGTAFAQSDPPPSDPNATYPQQPIQQQPIQQQPVQQNTYPQSGYGQSGTQAPQPQPSAPPQSGYGQSGYSATPEPAQPAPQQQSVPPSEYGTQNPNNTAAPQNNPFAAGQQQDDRFSQERARSDQMDSNLASKVTVAAGAGLADFTGSLGDHTNAGFSWNVRGGYDFSRNLGLEVGYLGARNGIDDTRLPNPHSITTTGLTGDLKLTAPIATGAGVLIKPYIFGGLGGAYYGVSGDTQLYQSDSDLVVPLGLGGDAFLTPNVSVGARLGYDVNVANRIGDNAAGNLMNLTANLGVHY